MSGVLFTHDLNHGSPYYVINYDDVSGLTNTVTSGETDYANRTLYIHRGAWESVRSERFKKLVSAVREIEDVLQNKFLDIEFALDRNLNVLIFQVREITTAPNWNRNVVTNVNAEIKGIEKFIKSRYQSIDGVYGETTVLGQMPDWNPVELIGRAPNALAYSLYRLLITQRSWRIARKRMGYAVPEGQELMVSLAGQPFIDSRLSFHSYLPGDIRKELGIKIVDHCVKKLRDTPSLHDKIEFEIAVTCYSLDIRDRINKLYGQILEANEKNELCEQLKNLTIPLISGDTESSIEKCILKINKLKNVPKITDAKNPANLFLQIENCIELGTIQFAMLARHGFIAKSMLDSMVTKKIFTNDESAKLMRSIRTITTKMVEDIGKLKQSKIGIEDFMELYGHLRPGTYDILSKRYDQMKEFESLLKTNYEHESETEDVRYILDEDKKEAIEGILRMDGITSIKGDQLINYIIEAVKGREYGKFVFTKTLSDIIESIAEVGQEFGLSREEMSNVPVNELMEIATVSSDEDIEDKLRNIAKREASRGEIRNAVRLPQVIIDIDAVHVIPFQVSVPNYITNLKASGKTVFIDSQHKIEDLTEKIVLIENADPGYDWIFTQKIAGLITKYGGANSHMAIRCAEFGIPAAIGCGEQRFESYCDKGSLQVDCGAGTIHMLS